MNDMRAPMCVALMILALMACTAQCARVTPHLVAALDNNELPVAAASSSLLQRWVHHNAKLGTGKTDPAYVTIRYFVKPEEKGGFIKAWQKVEKAVDKEPGNLIYDLKTPWTNNVELMAYGEWESYQDFMKHVEADYVRDFEEYMLEHDIAFSVEPLTRPDVGEVRPDKEQLDDRQQAHVLIRYFVPPTATEKFLDAWNKAEKGVEDDEKGVHIYSLRKVFWQNTRYYAYGTWNSMKEYQAHFESRHIQELLAALDKEGILWHMAPLKKLSSQPE